MESQGGTWLNITAVLLPVKMYDPFFLGVHNCFKPAYPHFGLDFDISVKQCH